MNDSKITKQVDRAHYAFEDYMSPARWASIWHQLDEVKSHQPKSTLEIGPGPGIFRACGEAFGLHVETADIDPEILPDHLVDICAMPFVDCEFDVVCAFQVLEHLPYDRALIALGEMVRISGKAAVISIPNAHPTWKVDLSIPLLPRIRRLIEQPFGRPKVHEFDGEHYWELGKRDYGMTRILGDFGKLGKIISHRRIFENPYHHIFTIIK